jgi:hypothetical protein
MRFALPIVALFVAIIAGQFAGPAQPSAQPPAIIEYIDEVKPAASTGPGFVVKPQADSECKCANCNCDELEKRVAALESKVASYGSARPVASNGSAGNGSVGGSGQASVSRPVTTAGLPYGSVVVSERVVSTQPTVTYRTMQPAQPVRNVMRATANGTCRIVNGVRVCN